MTERALGVAGLRRGCRAFRRRQVQMGLVASAANARAEFRWFRGMTMGRFVPPTQASGLPRLRPQHGIIPDHNNTYLPPTRTTGPCLVRRQSRCGLGRRKNSPRMGFEPSHSFKPAHFEILQLGSPHRPRPSFLSPPLNAPPPTPPTDMIHGQKAAHRLNANVQAPFS